MLDYTADKDLASIKLLAVDMDLTLLADDGTQPDGMAERIAALGEAGVVFCPASGRPGPTLEQMFPEHAADIAFCPDNGGCVIYRGEKIYASLIEQSIYREIFETAMADGDAVPVLCAFDRSYLLEHDRERTAEISKYYKDVRYVESPDELDAESDKASIYFPGYDAEDRIALYRPIFEGRLNFTNAGREWLDFMNVGVSKGDGIAHLCEHLGIDIADAAAVGDTYNDIQMLEAVGHSFIVANAEPHMEAHTKYRVPSNNDRGVAVLIDAILAAKGR